MELAVVIAALLSVAGGSVNYCGAKMCSRSNAHTYCQYAPGPGPRCTGYIEDPLSKEEKARVLARLNRRRAEAARGALKQLPPAGNMLKLRWVEELAREAQLWADQCAPPDMPEEHDACRDLYSISVGQCVASVMGEAPGLRAESLADTWFLQGLQYRGNISYSSINRRYDEDFAQMLWAHTYLVGCARSRFMSDINGRMRTVTRLVCNMAPRGPPNALWTPAAPASACPPRSRPDADLPALCSYLNDTIDIYDVSNEMTLEEQIVLNAVFEIERNASLDRHGSLDELYLTNLAIATLSHTASTEPYSSMQKRDIIEPIFKEETEIDETKAFIDDVIAKLVRDKTTKEPQIIRPKIVGRPKSYRIDELDSEFSEKDMKYIKARPVEIETTTMKDPDAYVEYEFQESSEKLEEELKVSVTESEVILTSIPTVFQNLTENSVELLSTTAELPLSPVVDNFSSEWNVTNDDLKKLLELSKKNEDYPSDPETARQLQEALERMEMTLAEENPGNHVKVRRELRRPPEQEQGESYRQPRRFQGPPPQPLIEDVMRNNSMAKPPVFDMVMKYLPFLKDYQKIRSAASSAKLDLYCVCAFILYV